MKTFFFLLINRRETLSRGARVVSDLKVEHEDLLVINPLRDIV